MFRTSTWLYFYLLNGLKTQGNTSFCWQWKKNHSRLGAMPCCILWGWVRATRSLHDEVPGIWFTSWPLFFLIFLQLLLTLLLLYFSSSSLLTSSSIVAVLIAKAGHVWVSWPEEFLLYFLSLTLQQVCYCQGID